MSHCSDRYECHHFKDADSLLRAIAPVPSLDTRTVAPKFIFRGHGSASWELIPSALRRRSGSAVTEAVRMVTDGTPATTDEQVFAEFHLIRWFVDVCDRSVIALPEDSYNFRMLWLDDQHGLAQAIYREPEHWPPAEHLPLLAFAQHHGIPTRLLDWTRSGTVAAYFAAADVGTSDDELAVWALNTELLHIYDRISLIPMPAANSARLGAQRGVFTLTRFEARRGDAVGPQDLSLITALTSPNEGVSATRPLWKLTLPRAEAVRLLYLCHLNGVDAASVYPDAAGAAMATKDMAAWSRTDSRTGLSAMEMRPLASERVRSERGDGGT